MNGTSQPRLPIVDLHVSRAASGGYSYSIDWAGDTLLEDHGLPSIAAALAAAGDDAGDFLGFRVDYSAVLIGTYAPQELRASSKDIADLCVERHAKLSGPE